MDYPGHHAVTDDVSWRTVAPWLGSPVEVIAVVSIMFAVAYAIFKAVA